MWKQKKQILCLMLAPMILLSPLVVAEEGMDENKWYVGAGLGISRLTPDRNGSIYSVEDRQSAGFKLTLGYDWSEKVSIEGYFSDLGEADMSPTGEVSYKDLGAAGLYHFYQQHDEKHNGWEAFVKTGLGWMKNDTDLEYERLHNAHLMFGLGGGYTFDNGLSIRADLDLYDEDSQFLTLSLMKRFGQAKQKQDESVSEVAVVPVAEPVDSDADGVVDAKDLCPDSVNGAVVDEKGCVVVADSDEDGVLDNQDKCLNTPKGGKVNADGCLIQIELEGVLFEYNQSKLTEESKQILDDMAVVLKGIHNIRRIEVVGHTDNKGAAFYNLRLSKSRAKSVCDYLVSTGIYENQLKAIGLGESRPIASNETEAGRMKNRRVELQLTYE